MYEWITITAYPWFKALHVIAVISWMAGMLYLPRLFVYHCDAEVGSKQSETFKVMERRLLKAIINPAMIITWLAGLYLAWSGHWFASGWLHVKLALVLALSAVHGFFSRWVKDFAADRRVRRLSRGAASPLIARMAYLFKVIIAPATPPRRRSPQEEPRVAPRVCCRH